MPKYLVIVESPNKVGKIKSFLGKDYEVCASVGHIIDLPAKGLNVDIKNNFTPKYGTIPGKSDVIKSIRAKAKKADLVYIMTDEDREGEGIASHISSILPPNVPFKRAVTNSITKSSVLSAIQNASDINSYMVDSYETRRILDRICGYKTSFTTKQATGGRSAGRVQSAALRILAEREKEIQSFVPQEYWPIEVDLERKNGERVTAVIKVPKPLDIKTENEANSIIDVLKKEKWVVSKYETKEKSNRAFPPFTTSSLYQSASSILSWPSKKTAKVAQELYENSRLTYIRSDSVYIVPEFISEMRSIIPSKYGDKYLSSSVNKFSNKSMAQEAHEAIRIIDIQTEHVPNSDHNRLYQIVWKRTIASQMSNMVQFVGSAEFTCNQYVFGANGSKVVFDGWRKVWDYGNLSDSELPEFVVGEELKFVEARTSQRFTNPPPRYTESSLTKELEKRGIGRPSTYATIPETLSERKYIEIKKSTIHTTDMGIRVSDFLVDSDFCFVDLDFTKNLENDLDRIANKEIDKLSILNYFWNRLKDDLKKAKEKKEEQSHTSYKCPKCDGHLVKKFSKFGPFYVCSNRLNKEKPCDYKCQMDKDGKPIEIKKKELEESDFLCPNCNAPLIKRTSKKGWEYLACRNWSKDEKCKGFYDKENGEEIIFKIKKKLKKK
jgi:DNA topoisomerase I